MDRSMLNKATSADETPTPGYLYGEIARSTFGDITVSQQLADYLVQKLQRDNPHVKAKCLKIIRHVCDQGKGDFRRIIQKRADVVKACLQYRGTPDALKGDAFNKAVRDEADAAVKSVFASDSSTNAYGGSVDSGKKMTGFGSEEPGGEIARCNAMMQSSSGGGGAGPYGGGGSSSGGGSGMVGFGNPNFNNAAPSDEKTYLDGALAATGSMFNAFKSKVQTAAGQVPTETPGGNSGGYGNNNAYGGFQPPSTTYRAPNMGGGGGSSGGFGSENRWGANNNSQPQRAQPSSTVTGEYEARVVNELCGPGGPRVAPSAAALEEFCRKCESLDGTAMAGELRKKLEDSNWQSRLKALHAIEALHDKGLDSITGHIQQFSSELLFECQDMPQCKVKASKVLYLFGFIDDPSGGGAPQARPQSNDAYSAPAAAPAAPVMDLLDMGDAPSQPSQPAASAGPSLLDGLNAAAPAPAPAAAPSSMLDMLGDPSPAPMQAAAPAPGGGLFGGLSVSSSNEPAYSPAAAPAAAEPPSLLAGLNAAAPPAQQAPADSGMGGLGGMFAGLSMGDINAGASASSPAPAAQPSSMDAGRTNHLNILGGLGGAGGMAQPSGGAMNGGGMMGMQQGQMGQPAPMGQPGPMGMQMGQPAGGMGMQMGQQMGGPMMGQGGMGMMGGGMMGNQMGHMGGGMMGGGMMGQPQGMGMGMGMGGMPQMQQQGMGMGMGMGQAPMGGMGGMNGGMNGMGGMGMSNPMGGMAGPGMSGPGSAFNFIGGAGGGMGNSAAQAPVDPQKAAADNAFSFVADEIRGAS